MSLSTINDQRRSLSLVLIAVLAMAGALFLPSQTAEASTSYGYHWTLAFPFDSSYNGVLTVEAGPGEVNDLDKVYVTNEYGVTCNRVGNVTLAGGVATFDGGYLRCDLDLASAIERTMEACEEVDRECSYTVSPVERYGGLKMYAKALSTQAGLAPIYHHPDASFAVDFEPANPATPSSKNKATLQNEIRPIPGIISSPQIELQSSTPTFEYYAARYLCAPGPNCEMHYSAGGGVTSVGPFASFVEMQTGSTAFHVGHNPDTGVTVPSGAAFDHIFIDPSATGEN